MQSTEFTCPRRRNEFWQTASKPSLRTSLCSEDASWKLSTKKETRIVRKTNYASKGPKVTLRNFRDQKITDVLRKFWETESKIENVGLWSNSIRTRNCKDKQYTQRIEQFQRKLTPRPRRKFMKQAIASCRNVSKGLTKYNVSVATQSQKMHSKYVFAEESWICKKNCFAA